MKWSKNLKKYAKPTGVFTITSITFPINITINTSSMEDARMIYKAAELSSPKISQDLKNNSPMNNRRSGKLVNHMNFMSYIRSIDIEIKKILHMVWYRLRPDNATLSVGVYRCAGLILYTWVGSLLPIFLAQQKIGIETFIDFSFYRMHTHGLQLLGETDLNF